MALTTYGELADYDLADLFTINFGAMDAWFEEDEQIFVHPKDPYKVCRGQLLGYLTCTH